MKALAKGLATIALLAATTACDGSPTTASAFVPENGGAVTAQSGSTLTFSSTQSYESQTPQTATGGVGVIDFTGSLTTSTPCYTVSGAHTTRGSTITVTVTPASTGGFCSQVITYNNYTGQVSGLQAGTYTFNVVHADGGRGTTVYSSTVTVQ